MWLGLKTIQARYTVVFLVFMVLGLAFTVVGINYWLTPKLMHSEAQRVSAQVNEVARDIQERLQQVEAQSRAITQFVATVNDSDTIDRLLPSLIDQYGDPVVFGGGIWPLPNQRTPGRDKHSSFFHRDASNKLIVNTYWNSADSLNYYEQPWHKAGMQAPSGHCAWAAAYKDDASQQPRTNCAMAITKNGVPYGVSTIDVTLGFFNKLVADKERQIQGELMIVEPDGKILSNSTRIKGELVLNHLPELASRSAFAAEISKQLSQTKGSASSQFVDEQGNEQKFFLRPIEGTPWLLAMSVPMNLLTKQSHEILSTLAWIQLPLVLLLLGLLVVAIRNLVARLEVLRHNIETLSAGDADLTARIHVQGHDEVDEIGGAVNRFIVYLQKMIIDVAQASAQIADELANLKQLARNTTHILANHASETDQVVTAITELSATADGVARHSVETASFTHQVNDNADRSKENVAQASHSVMELVDEVEMTASKVLSMQEDARNISSVLTVIGGIAEQTNLLALNAAIEAARAGEQGRGFAVVADEVRALAARTQKSTAEVSSTLAKLTQSVSEAVRAMEHTKSRCQTTAETTSRVNEGLDDMADSVIKINDLSNQIATAAEEQSRVTEDINKNMVSIRDMVGIMLESSEQTRASSDSLYSSNEQLVSLVKRFKV
jgi:methyl-accepting chemotaxis protein